MALRRSPPARRVEPRGAIESAAAEVEDGHGAAIDVVTVGDRRLDDPGEALVAAAREALTNAAKFAGGAGTIAVYAEMGPERAQVFVRDRGAGFDPASVPPTAAASASRSSAGWSATAAAR